MKKVGRKRALSPDQTQELLAKAELFQRIKNQCGPSALCRDYHISLTSLRTYTHGLHKQNKDEQVQTRELTPAEIDALLTRTVESRAVTAPQTAESEGTSEQGAAETPAVAVA